MLVAQEMLKQAGLFAIILLPLGAIGGVAGLAALLLAGGRPRTAWWLGVGAAAVGIACAGVGGLGAARLRAATEASIAAVDGMPALMVDQRRMNGYIDARGPAKLGLLAAALPLLDGIAALLIARRRRIAAGDPAPGLALPSGAAAAGVVACGFALAAIEAPLPGRTLRRDDPAWSVIAEVEEVKDAETPDDLRAACFHLEEDVDKVRTAPTPDLPAAIRRCGEDRLAQAAVRGSLAEVRAGLEEVKASALAQHDPDLLRQVEADLAAVAGMTAPPSIPYRGLYVGAVSVTGPLPREVVDRIVRQNLNRFRPCYEEALLARPSLQGVVTVTFGIGADGAVASVSTGSTSLPDAEVTACVERAFAGLSFPPPDGKPVRVVCPIEIVPGV